MPKLSEEVINKRKRSIESSARKLFIRQGFHATSMRDIAKAAKVSLGNLYNYFATKEAIFESIIEEYQTIIDTNLKDIFANIERPLDAADLKQMAKMVGELVNSYSDYWLLMYIDVLEFQNKHFRSMFDGISDRFGSVLADKFKATKSDGNLRENIDPVQAFTAVYMQFFNYFLVEKLFGGNRHFGSDHETAIANIIDIFVHGINNKTGTKAAGS